MKFPISYTLILILLSIILIASYPYFLAGNAEYLWGPIKGSLRTFYYFSIFLVFVGFLPFAYFLLTCDKWTQTEVNEIFAMFLILLFASWIWIILSVMFAKKSANINVLRIWIIVMLLSVSLSILSLIFILQKHISFQDLMKKQNMLHTAIYIGLGYGFFHTFFLDFIQWAYLVLF